MSPENVVKFERPGASSSVEDPRLKVGEPGPIQSNSDNEAGDQRMSDVTRHEMNARIEASEARVAMVAESIKSDMGSLRSEISANAKVSQAAAEAFYSKAGSVLSEIHLANEKHKNSIYGMGYKVIVWTVGTVVALIGLSIGAVRLYHALPQLQQ